MATVFVTQENHRLNYSDAERFGEVVFVNAAEYNPNPNSKANELIEQNIAAELGDFDPQEDYLLLSGDPISMILCFNHTAEIARRKFDIHAVRVLKWDGHSRMYNQIVVDTRV